MIKSVLIHILVIFASLCFMYVIAIFATASTESQLLIGLGALVFHSSPLIDHLLRTLFYTGYYLWKSTLFGVDPLKCFEDHFSSHIVLLSDVDVFFHMNNARYRKQMDFARLSFFGNSGMLQYSLEQGATVLMSAATGRYRQPLNLFKIYAIKTKIEYWDDEALYLKQDFISSFKDQENFVYSTNLVAAKIINSTPDALLTGLIGHTPQRHKPSEEIQNFMSYIKTSSDNLKKRK